MEIQAEAQIIESIRVGQAELALIQGPMAGMHIDGFACYASTSLTLHSNLARELVATGGAFIRAESGKHAPAELGAAVVLPAGKLPGRHLIVGVTNELRATPTLTSIGVGVAAIIARASQLKLRSLAIPLLRVGRALAPEDILRATLAPLFDHCSGPEPLEQLLIVSDDSQQPGALSWMGHFLRASRDDLAALGRLRAQAATLGEVEVRLGGVPALGEAAGAELRARQIDLQEQIWRRLRRSLADDGPGQQAIWLELQRCEEELGRLRHRPPLIERQIGS